MKKFLLNFASLLILLFFCFGQTACTKKIDIQIEEDQFNKDDGMLRDEDAQLIDQLKTVNIAQFSDLKFDDMRSMDEFLKQNDPKLHKDRSRVGGTAEKYTKPFAFQRDLFIVRMMVNAFYISNKGYINLMKKGRTNLHSKELHIVLAPNNIQKGNLRHKEHATSISKSMGLIVLDLSIS
ncbi:hypothetical protein [Dyadobacter psychrotolerans]|uniref:Uncharacterized protein n=1 Tax=Dyadobacter psychrotolerans TaxID=2541721 RepID=A0A4R5DAW7_9BACT|nr:hypothetical protein [Dyadobacter psychrotolerans]TDE10816.1 hypothetical protein E0F88_27470 [Dyadobacter psychrotolerans]